jgi:DNA-directed RNA polymerase specialized sigma24 family protein
MADAPGSDGFAARDAFYEQAASEFGSALQRLARAYEANAHRRQDLLQDIHIALWRSCATFDGRCSLRTWRIKQILAPRFHEGGSDDQSTSR